MKCDLHCHVFTNWAKGKRFSLERAPRTTDYILDAVRRAGMDGIALIDFGDTVYLHRNYEDFAQQSMAGQNRYRVKRNLGNALVMADDDGEIAVIRGVEFKTFPDKGEGHILALGLDCGIFPERHLGLEASLRKIASLGGVAIADHYWDRRLGIGEENLREMAGRNLLHGFEGFNANYGNLIARKMAGENPSEKEIEKLEQELGIGAIAVSDSHNRNDIGNGYIETNSLDTSNRDSLTESLKEILNSKERKFKAVKRRGSSALSLALHIGIIYYEVFVRSKLGWI